MKKKSILGWNFLTIFIFGTMITLVACGLNGITSMFLGYPFLDYPTIGVMSYFVTSIFIIFEEIRD